VGFFFIADPIGAARSMHEREEQPTQTSEEDDDQQHSKRDPNAK
jgi:hypothetical protein